MAEAYLEILTNTIASLELKTSPEVSLECKHYFLGAALFADGKIFASLGPVGYRFKLPAEVRTQLIDSGDADELRYYKKGHAKKEYVLFPDSIVEDTKRFAQLLETSIEYVTT